MQNPPESTKTPLEASEKQRQGVGSQEVSEALRKAFNLGQKYWDLGESPFSSDWTRADQVYKKFNEFRSEFSSKFN